MLGVGEEGGGGGPAVPPPLSSSWQGQDAAQSCKLIKCSGFNPTQADIVAPHSVLMSHSHNLPLPPSLPKTESTRAAQNAPCGEGPATMLDWSQKDAHSVPGLESPLETAAPARSASPAAPYQTTSSQRDEKQNVHICRKGTSKGANTTLR